MIEIHISDVENVNPAKLRIIANALLELAGDKPGTVTKTTTTKVGALSVVESTTRPATIAPEDSPAAGTDVIGNATEPDPASIFGGATLGNVPAANAAPSTAVAVPSSTAPAATTGTLINQSVPLPPVQNVAGGVTTVAAHIASPAPTGNGGVAVDKDGLPHDVRIHAATGTKNQDGRWKKKRGLDAAVVEAIEAELRAVMSLPGAAVNPLAQFKTAGELGLVSTPAGNVPTPPAPIPTPPAPVPVPPADTVQAMPLATAAVTTIATASPAPVNTIAGFAQLLPAVTTAITAGTLTEARVAEVLAKYGVTMLPQLAPRPDLVQAVAAELFPPIA